MSGRHLRSGGSGGGGGGGGDGRSGRDRSTSPSCGSSNSSSSSSLQSLNGGGAARANAIAVPDMCTFCFDVLYTHLYHLEPPRVPTFTNEY